MVLSGIPEGTGETTAGRRARRGDASAGTLPLGPHLTWLRLPVPDDGPLPPHGTGSGAFYRELGRWLGAYLSGPFRDQLL
jgi:hypothetical protein